MTCSVCIAGDERGNPMVIGQKRQIFSIIGQQVRIDTTTNPHDAFVVKEWAKRLELSLFQFHR